MKKGLIWLVGTLILYTGILHLMGGYDTPSFIYHTLLLAFPVGLVLLNRKAIQQLGLSKGKYQTGLFLAVGLIALALVLQLTSGGMRPWPTLNLALASTVIYTPITEELFFRGYFQPILQKRCGKWGGLLITAALFTVIHLPKVLLTSLATPAGLIQIFTLGIVFGFIRDKSQSVYYPMLGHIGWNLMASLG